LALYFQTEGVYVFSDLFEEKIFFYLYYKFITISCLKLKL